MVRRIFINMETKQCSKCKLELPLDNFCNDKKNKSGKQSNCKLCKSIQIAEYYKKNPHKKFKKTKEQLLERYYKNKVSFNFSRRMRKALNGLKQGSSWKELVGYDVIELKRHLEEQFVDGMSWENYGEWHIDHIKPLSSFNITDINSDEFKKCWSLSNLQPLWAKDNLKKYNKIL
jgi:hypothetical protein